MKTYRDYEYEIKNNDDGSGGTAYIKSPQGILWGWLYCSPAPEDEDEEGPLPSWPAAEWVWYYHCRRGMDNRWYWTASTDEEPITDDMVKGMIDGIHEDVKELFKEAVRHDNDLLSEVINSL